MKWGRNDWAEILASTGVAAVIGGYVRYSYQGELLTFSRSLIIGGGMANHFVRALGLTVGRSLLEEAGRPASPLRGHRVGPNSSGFPRHIS